LSVGAIFAVNAAKFTYSFGQQQGLVMSAAIAPADVLTISLMVIVVAVVASLQPAWKASRMDPVQALRHV
jgi:putative ABC transport system permease protein